MSATPTSSLEPALFAGTPDLFAERDIDIALICGRKLILDSYHALLSGHRNSFSVRPFRSAQAVIGEEHSGFDLVLYDIGLSCLDDPGGAIRQEFESLLTSIPDAAITILGDCEDWDLVKKVFSLPGVRGYIPTTLDSQVAIRALLLITAGGSFMPASCLSPDAWGTKQIAAGNGTGAESAMPQPDCEAELPAVTPRELQVLEQLRDGKSNKVIAYALGIEEATVKAHVRNILRKLGVSNRTQAAMIASRGLGPTVRPL